MPPYAAGYRVLRSSPRVISVPRFLNEIHHPAERGKSRPSKAAEKQLSEIFPLLRISPKGYHIQRFSRNKNSDCFRSRSQIPCPLILPGTASCSPLSLAACPPVFLDRGPVPPQHEICPLLLFTYLKQGKRTSSIKSTRSNTVGLKQEETATTISSSGFTYTTFPLFPIAA